MKYNSIGEQLIAKAQELDPNYKPDKFNDMSEALDVILNNAGSGDNYIDLVFSYQWLMDHINDYNLTIPANTITEDMLLQIASGKKKGISLKIKGPENEGMPNLLFLTIALELDMITDQLVSNTTYLLGEVGYWTLPLEDLSQDQICKFDLIEEKIWYNVGAFNFDTTSQKITQEQYNDIKALIDSNSLAGVVVDFMTDTKLFFPLFNANFSANTFDFSITSVTTEEEFFNRKSLDIIGCTIKSDLSITFKWDSNYFIALSVNAINRVIPTMLQGYQENISIGDGLTVENGALKTTIPPLPSDANTKTYILKSVNGVLTWSE